VRGVVVTCDKDLAQLVTDRITLLDAAKGARLGPAEVRTKMGVDPSQVADLLGLSGDAVDNIPGVPGIGPRTASALLAAFGSLDALFERLDEVPRSGIRGAATLRQKLELHREQALLSRRLAIVADDAPVGAADATASSTLASLAYAGPDRARLRPLLERLGFRRLAERLAEPATDPDPSREGRASE
jgi:5'-3' exonuclease